MKTLSCFGACAIPFLAACGGSDSTAAPIPSVKITGANAMDVTTVTLNTSFGLADAAGVVVGQLPMFVTGTVAVPGPEGGQVLLGLDDRDGNGALSTGDLCSLAFAAYGSNGQVLDGAVTFDAIVLQGQIIEGLTWILDARITFLGLDVTVGADTETIAGSVGLRREQRQTVRIMDLGIDVPIGVGRGLLLPGTTIGRNEYFLDDSLAWFVNGSVEADGIDGVLQFTTKIPFSGLGFLPAPYGGSLEVRGQDDSRITVSLATFAGGLEITIDADGDGDVDETLESDWADL